jgi:hypothetical protein
VCAAFFDLRGAAIDVVVTDAVEDFVNVIKALFHNTTTFDSYTVFSQPTPEDTPVPVWSDTLAITGSQDPNPLSKAMQQTLSFRATDFTIFKLVCLDAYPTVGLGRVTNLALNPTYGPVIDYIVDDVTWIASRGGGRPNTFLQLATTLNEKLRRSYRMN